MDESSGFCGSELEAEGQVAAWSEAEEGTADILGYGNLQGSYGRDSEEHQDSNGPLATQVRFNGKKYAKTVANATVLYQKLEAQGFRCAISGRELTPQTATLDHIKPRTDGGSDAIDNLQWVDDDVNRAKGTLELTQFAAMCRQVVAWMEKTEPNG